MGLSFVQSGGIKVGERGREKRILISFGHPEKRGRRIFFSPTNILLSIKYLWDLNKKKQTYNSREKKFYLILLLKTHNIA